MKMKKAQARIGPDLAALRILIVDDEADIRLGLTQLMESMGIQVSQAATGHEALQWLEQNEAEIVLTDLMMPGMSGAELLTEVKQLSPQIVVVILTGFGTIETAVRCLQDGASHFLTKPFNNDEIMGLVRRLGAQILTQKAPAAGERPYERPIIAEDPSMKRVLALVSRVAASPVPVLIEGESGTGKEVLARRLHAQSSVKDMPFLAVNAAALTDTLLESELFGHSKGSFTGADRDRKGLFEEARGGSIFLDEIASMSPAFQGKLLRVLQEKVVRPVGSSKDMTVDFRLICATNRELSELIKRGEFREDLFYRLRVVSIRIPPLRERHQDIVPLALYFLAKASEVCLAAGEPIPELSEDAQRALLAHGWPGNVRELENAISRALIVCSGRRILPHHLSLVETGSEHFADLEAEDYSLAKKNSMERFQREFVQRALETSRGNVSQAAASCGLTRAAFQRILRQLQIDRKSFADGK